MKKLKLYLDTSVVSQLDNSKRGIITRDFCEIVKRADKYKMYISPILLREIYEANEVKREAVTAFIKQLPIIEIPENKNAEILAEQYILSGVLSKKHIDDLTHIAYAVLSECDYIVSWNMKHLANQRTILRVYKYNSENGLPKITIVTPEQIINFGGIND
jgi:predicted nucleic acid-binding protein